jgi:hypothetical protein
MGMSMSERRRRDAIRERDAKNPLIFQLKEAAESRNGWQFEAGYGSAYMNVRNIAGGEPVVGFRLIVHANDGKLSASLHAPSSVTSIPLTGTSALSALKDAERYAHKRIANANTDQELALRYALRFLKGIGADEETLGKFVDGFPF